MTVRIENLQRHTGSIEDLSLTYFDLWGPLTSQNPLEGYQSLLERAVAADGLPSTLVAQSQSIHDRLLLLMQVFNEKLQTQQPSKNLTEIQVLGRLKGFIFELNKELTIEQEVRIAGTPYEVDLLVKSQDERVLVELKRPDLNRRGFAEAKHQLASYLEIVDVNAAILFVPTTTGEVRVLRTERQTGKGPLPVGLVVPATWDDGKHRDSE